MNPFIAKVEHAEYSCMFLTKIMERATVTALIGIYDTGGCIAKIFASRILRFPSHHIADAASDHGMAHYLIIHNDYYYKIVIGITRLVLQVTSLSYYCMYMVSSNHTVHFIEYSSAWCVSSAEMRIHC